MTLMTDDQKGPSKEAQKKFYQFMITHIIPKMSEEQKQSIIDREKQALKLAR
jgi:hypothetical protein